MCETKKILFIYNIIVTDMRPNQGQEFIFLTISDAIV